MNILQSLKNRVKKYVKKQAMQPPHNTTITLQKLDEVALNATLAHSDTTQPPNHTFSKTPHARQSLFTPCPIITKEKETLQHVAATMGGGGGKHAFRFQRSYIAPNVCYTAQPKQILPAESMGIYPREK